MTIPNGHLSDEMLIRKCRALVADRENWLYEKFLLSEKQKDLTERAKRAKANKENFGYAGEKQALANSIYTLRILLHESALERQWAIDELVRRGLCTRADHCDFLGVYQHEN